MKKLAGMIVVAAVAVSSANAAKMPAKPGDLCYLTSIQIIDEFDRTRPDVVPMMIAIAQDEQFGDTNATSLIAEIVRHPGMAVSDGGLGLSALAGMIDGILNRMGMTGEGQNANFVLDDGIGGKEALHKTISVDVKTLAIQIGRYAASGDPRRTALLRAWAYKQYGPLVIPQLDRCFKISSSQNERFEIEPGMFAVQLAMKVVRGGKKAEYDFITMMIAGNYLETTATLISAPGVKELFDAVMEEIKAQNQKIAEKTKADAEEAKVDAEKYAEEHPTEMAVGGFFSGIANAVSTTKKRINAAADFVFYPLKNLEENQNRELTKKFIRGY